MNFERLFDVFTPRVSSKIISMVLALAITVAGLKGFEYISSQKKTEENNENGTEETVQTDVPQEEGKAETEKIFSDDGALDISVDMTLGSALLCDMTKMRIVAQKEKEEVINCGEISVFATALLVSRAIDSGRIGENDYAVCPASAQKRPNYSVSGSVLSVGKKMTVRDILRCMIYQRGSSFAYTLAVHVSGSEEAFVSELNAMSSELKMSGTAFTNVCGEDDGIAKTTVYDAALLFKAFLNDQRLRNIFCSSERLVISGGEGQSSIYLTVANDFFVSTCTESQARADGVLGGKIGMLRDGKWSAVLFTKGESEYMIITLGSTTPYSDTLKIYATYL